MTLSRLCWSQGPSPLPPNLRGHHGGSSPALPPRTGPARQRCPRRPVTDTGPFRLRAAVGPGATAAGPHTPPPPGPGAAGGLAEEARPGGRPTLRAPLPSRRPAPVQDREPRRAAGGVGPYRAQAPPLEPGERRASAWPLSPAVGGAALAVVTCDARRRRDWRNQGAGG